MRPRLTAGLPFIEDGLESRDTPEAPLAEHQTLRHDLTAGKRKAAFFWAIFSLYLLLETLRVAGLFQFAGMARRTVSPAKCQ